MSTMPTGLATPSVRVLDLVVYVNLLTLAPQYGFELTLLV